MIIFLFIIYNHYKLKNKQLLVKNTFAMQNKSPNFRMSNVRKPYTESYDSVYFNVNNRETYVMMYGKPKETFTNNTYYTKKCIPLAVIAILEIIICLLLVTYPELHYLLFDGIDKPQYMNPFYQRAWASLLVSLNFILLVLILKEKNISDNTSVLYNDLPEKASTLKQNRGIKFLDEQISIVVKTKKGEVDSFNTISIIFAILPVKVIYYGIALFWGFILQFLETVVSNYFWNTNLSSSRSTLISLLAFVITIGFFIIHCIIMLDLYKVLTKKSL
jgi:hypothetical protein